MFTILVLSLCLTELGQGYSRMHIWEREMVESRTKRGGLLVLWVEKGDRRLLQELKAMRPRSGFDQQPHTLRSRNHVQPQPDRNSECSGYYHKSLSEGGKVRELQMEEMKNSRESLLTYEKTGNER